MRAPTEYEVGTTRVRSGHYKRLDETLNTTPGVTREMSGGVLSDKLGEHRYRTFGESHDEALVATTVVAPRATPRGELSDPDLVSDHCDLCENIAREKVWRTTKRRVLSGHECKRDTLHLHT